jgi:hypothetical protein
MDDRIRVSDADRDRVTARLREHFAAGRLTSDEMEERISAALHAKTAGDLRHVMADLPEPAAAVPGAAQRQGWVPHGGPGPQWAAARWSGPHWGGPPPWMVPGAGYRPHRVGPSWMARRRGPRLLPLVLVALIVALVLPGGGWVLFAFLRVMLLFWLVACLGGILFAVLRRRVHRYR